MRQRWFEPLLACPDCRDELHATAAQLACARCGYATPRDSGPLDLLPHQPRPFTGALPRRFDPAPVLDGLDLAPPPELYDGPAAARDSRQLFSALLAAEAARGDLLDLGCGPRDQAVVAEHLGLRYVGLDLTSEAADLRADAHCLPFRDESFDTVLSYAVLEHLHNPYVALDEVRRVMKPGARFVGTVAQGEPFHDSYLHHTLWGLVAVAGAAGLVVERIWPSRDTLAALAEMGSYPRPLRWLLAGLDRLHRSAPFLAPRRWLHWTERERQLEACFRAGSLCFLLRRPV